MQFSKPPRAYIYGFPKTTTSEEISSVLRRYCTGAVVNKSKNKGKRAKPYAVVDIPSYDELYSLLDKSVYLNGHRLSIEVHKDREELRSYRSQEILKRIFFNGLEPDELSEEEVRDSLERFGPIV